MVAAPFKGELTMRGTQTGRTVVEPFTCSDVNLAYAVFVNSGNTFYVVPEQCYITDISLSAAGTDTSQLNLKVGGLDSGITFVNSGKVNTINNRLPSPIGISAGRMLQLKQLT